MGTPSQVKNSLGLFQTNGYAGPVPYWRAGPGDRTPTADMDEFKKLTTVDKLSAGQCLTAVVNDGYIAVFNVDGAFHALDGSCPHMGGLLGNGTLDGCVVKCPEHGMRFDVTTGAMPGGGLSVKKFAVKVENGDVLVALEGENHEQGNA